MQEMQEINKLKKFQISKEISFQILYRGVNSFNSPILANVFPKNLISDAQVNQIKSRVKIFNLTNNFAKIEKLLENEKELIISYSNSSFWANLDEKLSSDQALIIISQIYQIYTTYLTHFKEIDFCLDFIFKDELNQIFILDYGLQYQIFDYKFHQMEGLSMEQYYSVYFPPELLRGNYNQQQSTIWSLGVIFLTLLTSKKMHHSLKQLVLSRKQQALNSYILQLSSTFSIKKEILHLILKMLVIEPNNRIEWNSFGQQTIIKTKTLAFRAQGSQKNQESLFSEKLKKSPAFKLNLLSNDIFFSQHYCNTQQTQTIQGKSGKSESFYRHLHVQNKIMTVQSQNLMKEPRSKFSSVDHFDKVMQSIQSQRFLRNRSSDQKSIDQTSTIYLSSFELSKLNIKNKVSQKLSLSNVGSQQKQNREKAQSRSQQYSTTIEKIKFMSPLVSQDNSLLDVSMQLNPSSLKEVKNNCQQNIIEPEKNVVHLFPQQAKLNQESQQSLESQQYPQKFENTTQIENKNIEQINGNQMNHQITSPQSLPSQPFFQKRTSISSMKTSVEEVQNQQQPIIEKIRNPLESDSFLVQNDELEEIPLFQNEQSTKIIRQQSQEKQSKEANVLLFNKKEQQNKFKLQQIQRQELEKIDNYEVGYQKFNEPKEAKVHSDDLQIQELEDIPVPQIKLAFQKNEELERNQKILMEQYVHKYENYLKQINVIGQMVVGCIELLEAQKSVWVIPLFLQFKRMCQMRNQVIFDLENKSNVWKLDQFEKFLQTSNQEQLKKKMKQENKLIFKEMDDLLIAAKKKGEKLEKSGQQKIEGLLNNDMTEDIKDVTFVYLYTQILKKINDKLKEFRLKKDPQELKWAQLQIRILSSLIIEELKPYDDSGQLFSLQKYEEAIKENNLEKIYNESQFLEKVVSQMKKRLKDVGYNL